MLTVFLIYLFGSAILVASFYINAEEVNDKNNLLK